MHLENRDPKAVIMCGDISLIRVKSNDVNCGSDKSMKGIVDRFLLV